MKVVLRKDVGRFGKIGDVVEVKAGYARNYLLPQGLAVRPTEANIKAVEAERQGYLEEMARQRAELEARAAAVQGKEITIAARANVEGHLYGSVGPAQVVAALAEQGTFLAPENIVLDPPIRQLDKYDIEVRFTEDISATIHLWVVPVREVEGEAPEAPQAQPQPDQEDAGNPTPE